MWIDLEDELKFWYDTKQAMSTIPNDYRSQNWTSFYNEVEQRIYDYHKLLNFLSAKEE